MEEGFKLLEELQQAEKNYKTAQKKYLDWYFNNAPYYEKTKVRASMLIDQFAIATLTIIAFIVGFILGKYIL